MRILRARHHGEVKFLNGGARVNAWADGINFPITCMTTRKQGFHKGHQTKCVISDGAVNAGCEVFA